MTSTPSTGSPLQALARQAVSRHGLPGLVVVVDHNGQEIFATGLGTRDRGAREAVDPDTVFGIASLTKLITAIALLRLEARGELSIDDPVARHWPTLRLAQRQPMRLIHLLSHSAGIPGLPGRFHARNLADAGDLSGGVGAGLARPATTTISPVGITRADELVDLINALDVEPLAPPGALLNYGNEGYCLLGGIIEAATGLSFSDAVQDLVLSPLGMTRTTIGTRGLASFGNVATPLARDGGGWADAGFWDAPLFYPTGGAVASARDLVRLMRALDEDGTLLPPASRQRLLQAVMPVASRPGGSARYGLALEHHRIDHAATLRWHSGQRAGVSSFMGWLPSERLAVAVLTNVADAPATSIGHEVIGAVLGREDIGWPPRRTSIGQLPADPQPRGRFAGRYATAEGFDISVIDTGDELVLRRSGNSVALRFADVDSGTVGDQTFRFLAEASGTVWAMALDLRVLPRDTGDASP